MFTTLLDTNLCVRALRDRPQVIRERIASQVGNLCISSVVRYELYVGVAQSRTFEQTRRAVDEFLSVIPCLPFDDNAALHAAQIRVDLERKGQVIGPHDLLIAGHARSQGLLVVTGNLREFSRVEGLRCEDWL
jgi:tRNA(fMet)-specific endonuclease VapC